MAGLDIAPFDAAGQPAQLGASAGEPLELEDAREPVIELTTRAADSSARRANDHWKFGLLVDDLHWCLT